MDWQPARKRSSSWAVVRGVTFSMATAVVRQPLSAVAMVIICRRIRRRVAEDDDDDDKVSVSSSWLVDDRMVVEVDRNETPLFVT